MAKPIIQVTGFNELMAALKKTDKGRFDAAMVTAGTAWLNESLIPRMQARAPRETGALANSVRGARTTRAVALHVGSEVRVPYAGPINFGWPARNIRAQEFIYSTIGSQDKEWEQSYIEALDTMLQDAFPEGKL